MDDWVELMSKASTLNEQNEAYLKYMLWKETLPPLYTGLGCWMYYPSFNSGYFDSEFKLYGIDI